MKKNVFAFASLFLTVALYGEINDGQTENNPPSCVENNCNWFQFGGGAIRGEFLYWKPEICGLESSFGTTRINTSVKDNIVTTKVHEHNTNPHGKWDPGFRLGADAYVNCLEVSADYTHFNGHAHYHNDQEGKGKWHLKYDTIDLTVGSRFYATECLYFKPFVGVRGARISTKLNSNLTTYYQAANGSSEILSVEENHGHFFGVGPEIGLEANWAFFCNLSLYGSLDVVTYNGHATTKYSQTDTFTSTVSASHGKTHHCFDNLAADGAIGIRWDRAWCASSYDGFFSLKLGWEQHRIYNFHDTNNGTLTLNGAVLAASLNFNY